jgi:hypothetical protein
MDGVVPIVKVGRSRTMNWTRRAGSNYPQHFEREGKWELYFEKVIPSPRWVICTASGDPPAWGRSHNSELGEDEVDKAQDWADKLINDHGNGLRSVHASKLV